MGLFGSLIHLLKPHSLAQVPEHFLRNFFRNFFRFGQCKAEDHVLRGRGPLRHQFYARLFLLAHRKWDLTAELGHCVSLSKANLPIHFDGYKRSPRLAGYQYYGTLICPTAVSCMSRASPPSFMVLPLLQSALSEICSSHKIN